VRIVRDRAAELPHRDREGELVPPMPNDRLVPEDFSEQVALTSPIPIHRAPHAELEASARRAPLRPRPSRDPVTE
jgi:hypothetical protein